MMNKKKMMVIATAVALMLTGSLSLRASNMVALGSDQVADDEDVPMPTFLYFMGKDAMQVIYWTDPKATDESDIGLRRQEQVRRYASKYTKVLYNNSHFVDVSYVSEILKDPQGNDAECGCIRNKWYPMKGLKYKPVHPEDVKKSTETYDEFFCLLLTEDYMKSRCFIPLRGTSPMGENNKPMAPSVVKKLEGRYGMKVQRSELIAKIGDRYTYGVVQFRPKGEQVLALEVVTDEDEIYVIEEKGQFDANDTNSVWNVDDGGVYLPGQLLAAFEGPQGLELCFMRWAIESATTGRMFLRDGQLIREQEACYYVYPENPKPDWVND